MRTLALCAVLGAGIAGTALADSGAAPAVTIHMRHEVFAPEKISVAAGTTVIWTNDDDMPHSATADGTFDSGAILPGKSFRWTAGAPGSIAYHCIFHPSMTAEMTVKAEP